MICIMNLTSAAAEAGINILCEKPLARNLQEAQELADAVRKSGVKAMCGYNYRQIYQRLSLQTIN